MAAAAVLHEGALGRRLGDGGGHVEERYFKLYRDHLACFRSFLEASSGDSKPGDTVPLAAVDGAELDERAAELVLRVRGGPDLRLSALEQGDDLQRWAEVLREALESSEDPQPLQKTKTGVLRQELTQSAKAGLSLLEQNRALQDEVDRLRGLERKHSQLLDRVAELEAAGSPRPMSRTATKSTAGSNRIVKRNPRSESTVLKAVSEIEHDLEAKEQELQAALAENANLRTDFVKSREERAHLQKAMADTDKTHKREHATSLAVWQIKKRAMEHKVDELERRNEAEQIMEHGLTMEKGQMENARAALEVRVISLEREQRVAALHLKNEQSRSAQLQRQVEALVSELEDLRHQQARKMMREKTIDTSKSRRQRLASEIVADATVLREQLEALQTENDTLSEQNASLSEENAELLRRVASLEAMARNLQVQAMMLAGRERDALLELNLVRKQLEEAQQQLKHALAAMPFQKVAGIAMANREHRQGKSPTKGKEVAAMPPRDWKVPDTFVQEAIQALGPWLSGDPPMHQGVLGIMRDGDFNVRYCALYPRRLDCWLRPTDPAAGEWDLLRVDLRDVWGVGLRTGTAALVLQSHEGRDVTAFARSGPDLKAWYEALLFVLHPGGAPAQPAPRSPPRPPSRNAQQRAIEEKPPPERHRSVPAERERRSPRTGAWREINTNKIGTEAARWLHGNEVEFWASSEYPGASHIHPGVSEKPTGRERQPASRSASRRRVSRAWDNKITGPHRPVAREEPGSLKWTKITHQGVSRNLGGDGTREDGHDRN